MKLALICTVPALLGSILGAKLAIDVSDEAFRRILAGVMIGVCVLMLVDPAKRLKFDPATLTRGRMAALVEHPPHVCLDCGRAAGSTKVLCEPRPLAKLCDKS